MSRNTTIGRRRFLTGAAAAVALGGMSRPGLGASPAAGKPLPPYAAWKDGDDLIVHSSNTIETRREAFGTSVITPAEDLFVRNNLSPPDESITRDPDRWSVTVAGVVNPQAITVAELKRIGIATVPMVLQCSGNGRGFFAHKASGTPWRVGAAGCVIFSGVPVPLVAKYAGGLVEGARFMTGTGGEPIPPGVDPRTVMVERSVPLEAMKDALLAWEMNGEPLPLAHGGPLRLVVPGYFGVNSVKYIRRLAFTAEESRANIQTTGYRVRPIGVEGRPDQPSMWRMPVKSWISSPTGSEPVAPGPVQIYGVAFGGTRPVRQVEVSIDGGKTWRTANFIGPDLGPYAWRQFVLPATLERGSHFLVCRATDAAGNRQPENRLENERGYGHNGWRDHGVRITVG